MSNLAPPAHYDLPWKTALTHAFRAFMRFFFASLHAQIDWRKRPRWREKDDGLARADAWSAALPQAPSLQHLFA